LKAQQGNEQCGHTFELHHDTPFCRTGRTQLSGKNPGV
jgi:hypothetical protein